MSNFINEFSSFLYNIAPNMHLESILLIGIFLVVLLSAIKREKFKKIILCLLVLIQVGLFFLAGILATVEGWGGIVAMPLAIGLNFVAGVLGLLVWWRLRDPEHALRWLQTTSILFLFVFPPLIVQMILSPIFLPLNKLMGKQQVERQQAVDEKRLADQK